MLWNEYTGTYRAISTTGTPSILLKKKPKEEFDGFHMVVLAGIIYNKVYLVQTGRYGAISTTDPKMSVCNVVKYLFEKITLQEDTTTNG